MLLCATALMPNFGHAAQGEPEICEALVTDLREHGDKVGVFEGLDAAHTGVPPEIEELLEKEGGNVRFIGGGDTGRVFRWYLPNGESLVIKRYTRSADALADDRLLGILKSGLRAGDYLRVIEEVRPARGNLRFFRDVQGVTLGTLNQKRLLPGVLLAWVNLTVHADIAKMVQRLKEKYGDFALKPVRDASTPQWVVEYERGEYTIFNLHPHNLVFEAGSGRVWIIDPR